MQLNSTMRLISGTLRSTLLPWLPVLSNIELPALQRKAATDKLVEKIVKHDSWPIQSDILSPPLLRLTSRKPLLVDQKWTSVVVDIKSRWRHNWKSAQVVNSYLVCDPVAVRYCEPHRPSHSEEASLHPGLYKRLRAVVVAVFSYCSDGGGSVGPVPWLGHSWLEFRQCQIIMLKCQSCSGTVEVH